MGLNLARLKELPAGVAEGADLIARLDECFLLGFARLGSAQHEALDAFAATLVGTPLGEGFAGALAALKRSEFLAKHFVTLAAARAAIQGAQYDALLQQAREALSLEAPAAAETENAVSPQGSHTALLASAQQWLTELALAGFKHLSMETLSPFMATLEQMQADPKLSRIASLFTGFLHELLMATNAAGEDAPVFRWVDLWTRGMILAQRPPPLETGVATDGSFYPLGADVRAHPYFVNMVVYGVLENGGKRRVVRATFSSYKVDVISGQEIWHLFRPIADPLMEALAGSKALAISDMQLLPSGDLLWTGKAAVGKVFSPFEVLADAMPLPAMMPLARHPVQLGEVAALEGDALKTAPFSKERVSAELGDEMLQNATGVIGLLRFDGGAWEIQPLCARTKVGKKEAVIMGGSGALAFCKKDKSKTLATLSERAGKLLRA